MQYPIMKKKVTPTQIMIIAYFALISTLCFIIFLLPVDIQESLKAQSDHWNLLTFFTSTFVYANLGHLLGNILAFLLLGLFVCELIYNSNREKRLFISLLLAIFLLPLIYNISFALLANFVIRRPLVSCGLSTVVAGIIGLIVPSLGIFLRELLQNERNTLYFLTSLMFLTGSAIAYPYTNSGAYNLAVFTATFIVGLVLLLHIGRKLLKFAKQNLNAKKKLISASIALFVYSAFLFSLFPSNIFMPEGNIVNIFAHYVGVFYGVISGIYTLNAFPKRAHVSNSK